MPYDSMIIVIFTSTIHSRREDVWVWWIFLVKKSPKISLECRHAYDSTFRRFFCSNDSSPDLCRYSGTRPRTHIWYDCRGVHVHEFMQRQSIQNDSKMYGSLFDDKNGTEVRIIMDRQILLILLSPFFRKIAENGINRMCMCRTTVHLVPKKKNTCSQISKFFWDGVIGILPK